MSDRLTADEAIVEQRWQQRSAAVPEAMADSAAQWDAQFGPLPDGLAARLAAREVVAVDALVAIAAGTPFRGEADPVAIARAVIVERATTNVELNAARNGCDYTTALQVMRNALEART